MVHVKREEGEAKRMHAGVAFYCSCQCLHVPVSVNRAGNARHTLWRRRTSSARASTIPAGKGQAKRSCAQNSRAWKCRRYEVFLAWKRRAFSLCGAGVIVTPTLTLIVTVTRFVTVTVTVTPIVIVTVTRFVMVTRATERRRRRTRAGENGEGAGGGG